MRRRYVADEPRPRGTVNLPSCGFRSSQVGVADTAGTVVVALFSYLSLYQQSRAAVRVATRRIVAPGHGSLTFPQRNDPVLTGEVYVAWSRSHRPKPEHVRRLRTLIHPALLVVDEIDEVMAVALLDSLLHRCLVVNIRGHSYLMRHHAELSKAIHPLAGTQTRLGLSGLGARVISAALLPVNCPGAVPTLPPWGSLQSVTLLPVYPRPDPRLPTPVANLLESLHLYLS